MASTTTATRAATAGRRRAHFQVRSIRPTGRASIGSPGEEAAQVLGQGLGTGVTPGRVLLQTLQADGLQVARQRRVGAERAGPAPRTAPGGGCPWRLAPLNGGRPVSSS